MRLFISIQAAMILIACCICGVVTSKQSDAGFIGEKNYEEVVKINSGAYIISEEDAVLNQSVEDYIDFFDSMYSNSKNNFFDKQIIIATAKDSYYLYDKSFQQEIVIDDVIDGDEELIGQTMQMLCSGGFYFETPEEFNKRIYHSAFLNKEVTPEENRRQFMFDFGGLNVMKPGHTYLIFAQSIDFGNYTMICADKHQYTWFDLSQTETKVMETNSFSDYCSNEIFTNSKAVVDDYYRLKKDVLNYYDIRR